MNEHPVLQDLLAFVGAKAALTHAQAAAGPAGAPPDAPAEHQEIATEKDRNKLSKHLMRVSTDMPSAEGEEQGEDGGGGGWGRRRRRRRRAKLAKRSIF
eukprot:3504285-Pyramimonas_sp.AAC.1